MPPKVDPAILRALSLDASSAQISKHGGSGFASTYRLTTPSTSIFIKTSTAPGAATMFAGEHASLNAIHAAVSTLCPRSFAWGPLDDAATGGYFLATEFLDLGRRGSGSGSGVSLAAKLVQLHTTPAPTPPGFDRPQFGFPVPTCCGETPQPNDFSSDWAGFFGRCRMRAIAARAAETQGEDPGLARLVDAVVDQVVARLLGAGHLGGPAGGPVVPVVTHGDLWAGNKGTGVVLGRGEETGVEEELVFDPSAVYAHAEWDHGIMRMFGGFGPGFWREYFDRCPKAEPVEEYDDRVALYESYHHLNHYAMFGGSYKSGAVSLLKPLVQKYAR